MFHCGYLNVNKSMSVFSNVVAVFGSIVKFLRQVFLLSYVLSRVNEFRS